MTRRKLPHEKLKPGPKPRASAPVQPEPAAQVFSPAAVASLEEAASEPPRQVAARWDDPLQRNRPVDAMDEAELRQYGIQIGLSRRDASDLGVERLRTACKQRVYDLIEEI